MFAVADSADTKLILYNYMIELKTSWTLLVENKYLEFVFATRYLK